MTTPPFQSGPYGQQPYGQGGGYGQYGQPQPPQQYGQPQYGQQPQYGSTQQWPNYGGLGQGPPEPPKNKTPMIVAIVAIAVLVIGGATVGIIFATKDSGTNSAEQTTTAATGKSASGEETTDGETTEEETTAEEEVTSGEAYDAEPGDCIKVNVASATEAEVEIVGCSDDAAIYRVGTREETDTESCPNDQYVTYTEQGRLLLCLQLNVEPGDCIEVTDTADSFVDCADPNVTNVVLDVFDGVDDETQCTQEGVEQAVTYPEPKLTICLGGPAS